MLLPGTQMHIVTFIFVSIEIVIFFYLVVYRLARPDDRTASLNIVLIFLLLVYNITGGLLPDPNMPGSYFIQETIAYATGFIVPCYFPYYVYKAFQLEKIKFHAHSGVYLCLMLPYFLFVIVFAASDNLATAKNILLLPVLYALWVIISLFKAIQYKYKSDFSSKASKEELTVLLLSLTPWIGLPAIAYFDLSQTIEASVTNTGFLLLLALQVKNHVTQFRTEHKRLIDSETRLLNWNTNLKKEVAKRTNELERMTEQKMNTFINLAHETKTPITLIKNYLDEYISKRGYTEELSAVKRSIDKLSNDIINLFDLERFNKGLGLYDHSLISNFSEIVTDNLILFKQYAVKKGITINEHVEENVFIKAEPVSVNRIINNLIENAIKYSNGEKIDITLASNNNKLIFSVRDYGIGIPPELHKKIFEPYFQITNPKNNMQGMGLGLPIVKKIVEGLNGKIEILSNPKEQKGTNIIVELSEHTLINTDVIAEISANNNALINIEDIYIDDILFDENKETILLIEDNVSMINYLANKFKSKYNIYTALNGNEALKKIKTAKVKPDLIITDIMMDKLDGYSFAKIISTDSAYNHIPIVFLSAKSAQNDRLRGLKYGAIDFIAKPFSIQELTQKIDSVLANAQNQKRMIIRNAFNKISRSENITIRNTMDAFSQNCQLYNLTDREKAIAKLICEGNKYKEIGETLFIAERTVTKHVQNIFEKLDVSNKVALINKLEFQLR